MKGDPQEKVGENHRASGVCGAPSTMGAWTSTFLRGCAQLPAGLRVH